MPNSNNSCAFVASVHALHNSIVATSNLRPQLHGNETFQYLQMMLTSRNHSESSVKLFIEHFNKRNNELDWKEYQFGQTQDAAEVMLGLKSIMTSFRRKSINEGEAQIRITCKCSTKITGKRPIYIMRNNIKEKLMRMQLGKLLTESAIYLDKCQQCGILKREKVMNPGRQMLVIVDRS